MRAARRDPGADAVAVRFLTWRRIAAVAGFFLGVIVLVFAGQAGSSSPTENHDQRALARIRNPPLGLPAVPIPGSNPPTVAKIHLGRKLVFDRRLSRNGTLSCAMCHVPEQGFAVNEIGTAVGMGGKSLRRNAPTLLNVAYAAPFFHDGREPELDLQPFDVFLNPDEMAAPSLGSLVARIRNLPDYEPLFKQAYGERPTVPGIGMAIGSYLRSLLSGNTPFDRWRFGRDPEALSPAARHGFELFTGKAGCVRCHTVQDEHALFSDGLFHDTGLGWFKSMARHGQRDPVTVQIAPGMTTSIQRSVVESLGNPPVTDLGRYEVTGDPAHRWQFKTPSLRNVALTAPYLHDGSFLSLRQVVEFYNRGAHIHPGLDPKLRPLGLGSTEIDDLVAFLNSLTGDNIQELVRDARSQRVGNPGDRSPVARRP